MAKVREISWPEEYCDLKRIEEFMVCGICYEYMDTPVMTPCSHNYCSLCIRKYLHYKAQCPACFHVFFEKDLYVNRALDGMIQHYLQIREKLITLIEHRVVYNSVVQQESEPPSTPPIRPARNGQFIKSPKLAQAKSPRVKEIKESELKTPIPSTSKVEASNPNAVNSPKVLPTIAKIFNTPKRKEAVPQPSVNTKTVLYECPVCKVAISENHVNVHLDACLKREKNEEKEKVKPSAPKRPPLPKLVLRVMKDAELRKKMKELGLPTQGDRRTLENRFTRYTTIYNAESDKLEPRPIPELIRQCEMEEKQERKMDSFLVSMSTSAPRLLLERNAKEEEIEEAKQNYRVANKSSFDKLIEEVRNRRKMLKKQTDNSNSQNYESADSSTKPSTSVEADISENLANEENPVSNLSNEIAFQDSDSDSDSDTPCPLQHYRSDFPRLSNNLNNLNSSASESNNLIKRPEASFNSNDISKIVQTEKETKLFETLTDDDSTDDENPYLIAFSPILNKSLHRKRPKLSNKSTIFLTKNVSKEKESQELKARDLCISIINDFASEVSSNEFANKLCKEETKIIEVGSNGTSQEPAENKSTTQRENGFRHQHKKIEDTSVKQNNVDNELNNTLDNFSFDMLNGDDSSEHVNISSTFSLGIEDKTINENIETLSRSSSTKVEKENDAFSVNENSHQSNNESSVCRPVRKRNRPARFAVSQIVEPGNRDKIKGRLSEGSQESDSPDNLKNTASDGSFKRRRGRSKMHSSNLPLDQVQNPPKRPVRRRQATSDRN